MELTRMDIERVKEKGRSMIDLVVSLHDWKGESIFNRYRILGLFSLEKREFVERRA